MKKIIILILLVVSAITVQSQSSYLGGVVHNLDGEQMVGVSVMIKGTSTGVTTDLSGCFLISAKLPCILVFSFNGFITQEVSVGSLSWIPIVLLESKEGFPENSFISYRFNRTYIQKKTPYINSFYS